jgi:hypothetical protein
VNYPSAVEFNRRGILLVVGDQCACDGGYDSGRRDVSQSRAQLQCLALSGACGENMRGDLVAGEHECRHYSYRYEETMSMLRAEVLRRSTLACGLASPARASLHLSNFFAVP